MSKKKQTNHFNYPGYTFIKQAVGIEEYQLRINGLRVLFHNRPDTGVVTTNITYFVGARDEERGVTGVAHMLEHMLFKPTAYDLKRPGKESSSMKFERETGCVLNANTWKDRTTYYFSYPREFFERALLIEAERMNGVVLTDKELKPEQGNVLSEFDMYNGDPNFALSVQMANAAFSSHPYGHETIGFREDIEDYTADKLEKFYRNYYRPDNAIMMVVGDIDKKTALEGIKKIFSDIKNPTSSIPRFTIREPKQEGLRRVTVERPSNTNLVSIGFKHPGFPTEDWFVSKVMIDALTSGPESILHRLLVDTGLASSVEGMVEPTSEENLGTINVNLAPNKSHAEIENLVIKAVRSLDSKSVDSLIKKTKEHVITDELFSRQSSLNIVQELTEYSSAGSFETYADTTKILDSITTKKVLERAKVSFVDKNMTIGHFVGKI
jgi:zinc protease